MEYVMYFFALTLVLFGIYLISFSIHFIGFLKWEETINKADRMFTKPCVVKNDQGQVAGKFVYNRMLAYEYYCAFIQGRNK